jgi:ADP-ribose pyrophosphatase YjhB (NUDIX family)
MQTYIVRSRAVIVHEGKLLVVHHPGRDFHALPGGHVDSGENPKECMERELVEELGIRPVVGRLLYVYTYINKEGVHSVEFFFEIKNSVDYLLHENMEKTHAHEIDEVRWAGTDEVVRILPPEFFEEFKSGRVFDDSVRFLKG